MTFSLVIHLSNEEYTVGGRPGARCSLDARTSCIEAGDSLECAESDVARIADKLAKASIAITVLPQTNLYLQDRGQGTPDRRGLTRLHELRARGVTVALGADNVRDAFGPVGRHDPRHVLALAVGAAHLDPPLGDHLPLITTAARRGMGLPELTVDGSAVEDLLICDAGDTSDLITGAELRPLSETRSLTR